MRMQHCAHLYGCRLYVLFNRSDALAEDSLAFLE